MGRCGSGSGSSYSDRHSVTTADKTPSTSTSVSAPAAAALHSGSVFGLYRISEEKVVSCGEDKRIVLHNWGDATTPATVFSGHTKPVNRVAVYGNTLYSVSRDLSLRCWDIQTGSCLHSVESAHSLNLSALALSSSGTHIGTGSRDYTVKRWDTTTVTAVNEFKVPRNIVTCLRFDTDTGDMLYQVRTVASVR
jgi:WD40 repeat protein